MSKYFCIGTHKTGTTSINHAFKYIFKWNVCAENIGYDILRQSVNDDSLNYELIKQVASNPEWNFYQDSPFNHNNVYKYLYQLDPSSKFILTYRNSEEWFKSLVRWNQDSTNVRDFGKWFHATEYNNGDERIVPHKVQYIKTYEKRIADIKEFFADKPNSLLILDVNSKDKWSPLCEFIGEPIPKVDYPHEKINDTSPPYEKYTL